MTIVAALYIDPRGPYPRMAEGWQPYDDEGEEPEPCIRWEYPRDDGLTLDCWDATRDARLYAGPHPVVAHPPCKHWGRLRHLAKDAECWHCHGSGRHVDPQWAKGWVRCGGCAGTGRVSDRDCAPRAVEQVRAYGGVLEHPAGSKLWDAFGLPEPCDADIQDDGRTAGLFPRYTIELDQCEWGHVARKRTWLYLVGVPRTALEAPPFPGRKPTHWISGGRGRQGKKAKTTPVPPGIKVCSAQQRRRTPPLFAEYLVRLARAAQK